MSYIWNDNNLKKKYLREKKMNIGHPIYNFTEKELESPYLSEKIFKTQSAKTWRKIVLAFILGRMSGIKSVDEGKSIISNGPIKDIYTRFSVIPLYSNYNSATLLGDIYDKLEDLLEDHPSDELAIGFGIKDNLLNDMVEIKEYSFMFFSTYDEAKKVRNEIIKSYLDAN